MKSPTLTSMRATRRRPGLAGVHGASHMGRAARRAHRDLTVLRGAAEASSRPAMVPRARHGRVRRRQDWIQLSKPNGSDGKRRESERKQQLKQWPPPSLT